MASSSSSPTTLLLVFGSTLFFCLLSPARSSDVESLLSLKSSIDPSNSIPWRGTDLCSWEGVKECLNGRVSKLVLEYLNLTGPLDSRILNQLDQLRVLSFKSNSLSGPIPNLSGLHNLKSVYLNDNNFTGSFPESLTSLHRLKTINLSGNRLSGKIPTSLLRLSRLYTFDVQENRFAGSIPPLNQTSLRFFNVSGNKLSGEIPPTRALKQFDESSFAGNADLCGDQIRIPCGTLSPAPSAIQAPEKKKSKAKLIGIIAGSAAGGVLIFVLLLMLLIFCCRRRKSESPGEDRKGKGIAEGGGATASEAERDIERKDRGFSWERSEEGAVGTLVFLGASDSGETTTVVRYTMEDLLKASAETLGRGTLGSTYKAVMESGFIVTVKRLKNARYPRMEEFKRHVEILGQLRHPNLVSLRAYFQAKEERLLVYDYFPNGSLFTLIHGTRASGNGKPLHWTSCLKIAEDLASALLYIHQNPGLTHGNLKSSNVLLGPDFESCLTDYGLSTLHDPDSAEETSAVSLFYKAPECRDPRRASTQPADVYSFGVLLLELLTGRTPFQDLVQEYGSDISRWVRAVREEETESGEEPTSSGNEASEEKLQALLSIANVCVTIQPENRPVMREVLKMVRDARADAPFSSNSSEHSPGRWSDTVQSLPREDQVSM
ncbi:Protein kinase domain-containing protein [Hirschfeldia incana]|nr:Protein kinase domain-containing protein [Hirschfeldia incana]